MDFGRGRGRWRTLAIKAQSAEQATPLSDFVHLNGRAKLNDMFSRPMKTSLAVSQMSVPSKIGVKFCA